MYPHDYRSGGGWLRPLLLALGALGMLAALLAAPRPSVLSRWAAPRAAIARLPELIGSAVAQPPPPAIIGVAVPQTIGLASYNAESELVEAAASGALSYYRRSLPSGGTLAYFVVRLGPAVHVEVINADGATPGSDARGDTIWLDGKPHRATVAAMAQAPYALRAGRPPLAAIAFGFHGEPRTSDEGTVVINGTIHRVNAGRAALCITADHQASIGLFDAAALARCAQANGAGPVILWQGKVANPAVQTPDEQFVPFNPLGEDFVQLDWRRKIYTGAYPKTAIGVGQDADGTFLILATSYGLTGIELAGQLKAIGCRDALGGDDDTSTQAVWRGQQVQPGQVRAVPDAIAVYVP